MDVRNCCDSCKRNTIRCCCNDEIEHANCISSKMRWKVLWMKLKKEKKKLFESASSSPLQLPYDPYTYSLNFDRGTAKDEPDNLSRSFSAKFADPSSSKLLVKKEVV